MKLGCRVLATGTNRRRSCLQSKTFLGPEAAPNTNSRQCRRMRAAVVVVVVELPQTREDDLISSRAAREKRTS